MKNALTGKIGTGRVICLMRYHDQAAEPLLCNFHPDAIHLIQTRRPFLSTHSFYF